jgi:glucose/arabinose dehydrogenase
VLNHNGGESWDRYLYIGMGDGGSANDPMGNGQNRRVLLGKLLRIDVGGTNANLRYRIPDDNPFAGQAADARPEIWAYGLRNPWRVSFDSQTGALWLPTYSGTREIDVIEKGGNYGWKIMEGSQCLGGGSGCEREGLKLPVLDYANSGGNCSITGGDVYRGRAIASLRGAYVYGDYCSGRIWALRYDGSKVTEQGELLDSGIQISSFAVDGEGEIYALQYSNSGGIFRLVQ